MLQVSSRAEHLSAGSKNFTVLNIQTASAKTFISLQPVVQSWGCQIYVSPTNNRALSHWNSPPQCVCIQLSSLRNTAMKTVWTWPLIHTHTARGVLKTASARLDKSYFSHVILHGGRCHTKLNGKDKTSQVVPVLHGSHGDSEKWQAPWESLSDSSLCWRKEQNMLSGLLALGV